MKIRTRIYPGNEACCCNCKIFFLVRLDFPPVDLLVVDEMVNKFFIVDFVVSM